MNRATGVAVGAAMAFGLGLALSACSEGEAGEAGASLAAESVTTQATQPVVTVYKSPT